MQELEEDPNIFNYLLDILVDSGLIQHSMINEDLDVFKSTNFTALKKLQRIFTPIFGKHKSSKEFYKRMIINEEFDSYFSKSPNSFQTCI